MSRLVSTPDFRLGIVTQAGLQILSALKDFAEVSDGDVVLTAGTNGTHSGPADPHFLGNAFDVRLLDRLPSARISMVVDIERRLGPSFTCLREVAGATPQTTAEHLHIQLKKVAPFVEKPLSAP